jgi:hypothetical protein
MANRRFPPPWSVVRDRLRLPLPAPAKQAHCAKAGAKSRSAAGSGVINDFRISEQFYTYAEERLVHS